MLQWDTDLVSSVYSLQVHPDGLHVRNCSCPAFDRDLRGCKHMFLIPLVHKDYFVRTPVGLSNDEAPMPRIRGGTPVPIHNDPSSSRPETQPVPQETVQQAYPLHSKLLIIGIDLLQSFWH